MRDKTAWLDKRLEEIMRIKAYSVEYSYSAKRNKIETRKLVKLDANENFFLPQTFLTEMLSEVEVELDPRLYPQSEKMELIDKLSEYMNLQSDCFAIGNGSDELIEIVVKAFLRRSERCISISPTFSMYGIIVEAHGNLYDAVPLGKGFILDVDSLLSKATSKTVLCILCSPNNPTGNQFELSLVQKILEEFRGIVVVDEAYVEFAPFSIKDAIKEFSNLVVLKTFSKAFGLAGLRIGYALACPEVISALRQVQLPYNVSTLSMRMASKVLEERKVVFDAVEKMKAERSLLIKRLNSIPGITAFNSDANFILIKTERDVEAIFTKLRDKGMLIRNIGNIPDLGGCLRVTVGLPEMNNRLINTLKGVFDG